MASPQSVNSANPLLHDFDSSDLDLPLQKAPIVSLRALEDGHEDHDNAQLRLGSGFWKRWLMEVRRRRNGTSTESEHGRLKLPGDEQGRPQGRKWRWRRHGVRTCLALPVAVLCFFGLVHIINVLYSSVPLFKDEADPFFRNWSQASQLDDTSLSHFMDITKDVTPIPCHSHNDYWRRIPLYDALRWGCTGVEADVWLVDNDLLVGHNTRDLTVGRTFRSMYVEPLIQLLDRQNAPNKATTSITSKNGIFHVDPAQTLVLLVDFKTDGRDIYPVVSSQLAAFREKGYLTYFDGKTMVPGPITVVATGNAPFDLVSSNTTYRDIFFDAPLDRMYEEPSDTPNIEVHNQTPRSLIPAKRASSGQGTVGTDENSHFDITNSYYASVSFKKSIGWVWFGRLSEKQMQLIRGQIQGAKKRGLKARYWSTPTWPIGLRNHIWEVLVREGVDYLNGDDLEAMTSLDWSIKKHWGWLG